MDRGGSGLSNSVGVSKVELDVKATLGAEKFGFVIGRLPGGFRFCNCWYFAGEQSAKDE